MDMVQRREFLFVTGALVAAPLVAEAQPAQRVYRIGFLGISSNSPAVHDLFGEFREGMAALGWVEGRNYVRVDRWAHGEMTRLPALAAELVGLRPDALMAAASESALALRNATRAVPIVAIGTGDPVQLGLTRSLSRPSENITGPAFAFPELVPKQLEIVKEAFPHASRVAALIQADMANKALAIDNLKAAAPALRLRVEFFEISKPEGFEPAFQAIRATRADAALVVGSAFMFVHRAALAKLALQYQLPTMWNIPAQAEAGGLMAYGVNVHALWRRAAVFMDKIFRGANPGDIPFERPSKFELVINMRTAKALGITFPKSVLLRADRVIE